MTTAELLQSYESCHLKGYFSRNWESNRLTQTEMIQSALRFAFLSTAQDYGEEAGNHVMELGHERGLADKTHSPYESVCHAACLSDILSTAIRSKGGVWRVPEVLDMKFYVWEPSAFLAPANDVLRRVVIVSNWSEERELAETRSWKSLGEVCHYEMPMQLVVAVLGSHRDGRRHCPFTQGLLHPRNGKLRFKKRTNTTTTGFKDTWTRIWREDYADIDKWDWLAAMQEDDVLRECLFTVEIPVPEMSDIGRIRDMAAKKLERLQRMKTAPEPNLSTCHFPVICPYFTCCHELHCEPSEKRGFLGTAAPCLLGDHTYRDKIP